MLEEQNYKCLICAVEFDEYHQHFSVDHCHTSGTIRGLLCNKCNMGIGYLNDSIDLLQNAISYLTPNIEDMV